jgi:hypothetical protein
MERQVQLSVPMKPLYNVFNEGTNYTEDWKQKYQSEGYMPEKSNLIGRY